MDVPETTEERVLAEAQMQEADLAELRSNLALTPARRIAELTEMNRFHAELQERTVPAHVRRAIEEQEREEARRRLATFDE